jgi:hypothetical protein
MNPVDMLISTDVYVISTQTEIDRDRDRRERERKITFYSIGY